MQEIKLIIKDGGERTRLFKSVFGSKEGQIALAYLEHTYKGKVDMVNPNNVYYRLGQRDTVAAIRAIVDKQQKVTEEDTTKEK
jgi:hypothetical protein